MTPPFLIRPRHQDCPITVCCDIDETLSRTVEGTLRRANAHFGTNFRVSEVNAYNFSCFPEDVQQFIFRSFADPELYMDLQPYQDGIKALRRIRAYGAHIVLATDRPTTVEEVTKEWLDSRRVPYDDLLVGPGSKPYVVAQHEGPEPLILIDDNPASAAHTSPTVHVYFPHRGWNKDLVAQNVVFKNWATVEDQVRILCDTGAAAQSQSS